jgi:YfiH family protein
VLPAQAIRDPALRDRVPSAQHVHRKEDADLPDAAALARAWQNDNERQRMHEAFKWTTVNGREYLQCEPLSAHARHLFSTRQLELPADPGLRRANLAVFASDLGVTPDNLLRARQVHGRAIRVVRAETDRTPDLVDADAIVSAVSDTACAVQVADCVPILIAGEGGLVAAIHAGWRGTAAGIAAEAVKAMNDLGADPTTLVAAIGPSIRQCCYQVDARVRDAYAASNVWPDAEAAFEADGQGHWLLDVAAINRATLERAGLSRRNIFDSGLCTACDLGRFYSYRAEGAGTGRLVAGIVTREAPPFT